MATKDPKAAYKVDMMLGLCDDLSRAFQPGLYLGMRHTVYGYRMHASHGTRQ